MIFKQVRGQINHICDQLGLSFRVIEEYALMVKFSVKNKEPNHWFSTDVTITGANVECMNRNLLNYFTHAHELYHNPPKKYT